MYQSSHPCKVYDSMFFSIFPDLYNHHQSRGKERSSSGGRGCRGRGEEWKKKETRAHSMVCSRGICCSFSLFPTVIELYLPDCQINSLPKQRESKRKPFIRKTETHRVKKLSCTDQKCNHRRQALRVFQSLWGCINLKSCYIKEKNVWESLPMSLQIRFVVVTRLCILSALFYILKIWLNAHE